MERHWAYDLIGQLWSPDKNCWWLMRHTFMVRFGMILPEATEDAVGAFAKARSEGWERVRDRPRDADIIVLKGPYGRHFGTMLKIGASTKLFHCEGCLSNPLPGVMWEEYISVMSRYSQPEIWRHSGLATG